MTAWTQESLAKEVREKTDHKVEVKIEFVIDGTRHAAVLCIVRSQALCQALFTKSTAEKERISSLEVGRSCLCTKTNQRVDFIITRIEDPMAKLYKDDNTGEMIPAEELYKRISKRIDREKEKATRRTAIEKEVEQEVTSEMYNSGRRRRHRAAIIDVASSSTPNSRPRRLSVEEVEKMGFDKVIEDFVEEGSRPSTKEKTKKGSRGGSGG